MCKCGQQRACAACWPVFVWKCVCKRGGGLVLCILGFFCLLRRTVSQVQRRRHCHQFGCGAAADNRQEQQCSAWCCCSRIYYCSSSTSSMALAACSNVVWLAWQLVHQSSARSVAGDGQQHRQLAQQQKQPDKVCAVHSHALVCVGVWLGAPSCVDSWCTACYF